LLLTGIKPLKEAGGNRQSIKFRLPLGDWQSVQTARLAAEGAGTFSTNADGTLAKAVYTITNNAGPLLRLEVTPEDGVRRRFDAILDSGKLSLILDNDQFAADRPITPKSDLSATGFSLESADPAAHTATLHLSASASGPYLIRRGSAVIATVKLAGGREVVVPLPVDSRSRSFAIERE
jgi:hypothetical protein